MCFVLNLFIEFINMPIFFRTIYETSIKKSKTKYLWQLHIVLCAVNTLFAFSLLDIKRKKEHVSITKLIIYTTRVQRTIYHRIWNKRYTTDIAGIGTTYHSWSPVLTPSPLKFSEAKFDQTIKQYITYSLCFMFTSYGRSWLCELVINCDTN